MYVSEFLNENQEGQCYVESFNKFKTNKTGGMELISATNYLKIKINYS